MSDRIVALIAGGTAGHVNLALSVAESVARLDSEAGILFVGTANSVEAKMLAETGWDFAPVPGKPYQRTGPIGKLSALVSAVRGFRTARRLLRARRVTTAIGFGAYASFGGTLAARSLGLPTAIMEPNAELGMANRFLRRVADLVFIGWEECDVKLAPERKRVHGVPIRGQIEALHDRRHQFPGTDARTARILIMAGAEDSRRFNEIVGSLVRALRREGLDLEVRHQTGPADVESIRREWHESGIDAMVESRFASVSDGLDWADFVIARSGASTIAETALTGRPALFVPLSGASEDHQSRNAELIARRGGALWSRESPWNERDLASRIAAILASPEAWSRAAERMRSALRPGASERIAKDVLAMSCDSKGKPS